jgi:hypothetical protein
MNSPVNFIRHVPCVFLFRGVSLIKKSKKELQQKNEHIQKLEIQLETLREIIQKK